MFRRFFGESKSKDNRHNSSSESPSRQHEHRQALQTINQLQQSEQIIDTKLNKFDQQINDIQDKTRLCLTKTNPDRSAAIRLIKRRKILEEQREKLTQIKENVQLVNEQVQTSHFNRQVTETLNIGQEHLKRAQKSMPTKDIELMIDNLAEQIDLSNEINDFLATPFTTSHLNNVDQDFEKELNQFNQQDIILPEPHSSSISIDNQTDQQIKQLQRMTAQ